MGNPKRVQAEELDNIDLLILKESRGEKRPEEVELVIHGMLEKASHRESFKTRLFRGLLPSLVKKRYSKI